MAGFLYVSRDWEEQRFLHVVGWSEPSSGLSQSLRTWGRVPHLSGPNLVTRLMKPPLLSFHGLNGWEGSLWICRVCGLYASYGCMQVKVEGQGLEAFEGTTLLSELWECPQLWLSEGRTFRSGSLVGSWILTGNECKRWASGHPTSSLTFQLSHAVKSRFLCGKVPSW